MGKRKPPEHVPSADDLKMPLLYAIAALMPRLGMEQFEVGYNDDVESPLPLFWYCAARQEGTGIWELDCAIHPEVAAVRLGERLVDGGQCQYCGRPTGLTAEWEREMPLEEAVCWYRFDPETTSFRRGCEGNEQESPRER